MAEQSLAPLLTQGFWGTGEALSPVAKTPSRWSPGVNSTLKLWQEGRLAHEEIECAICP